MQPLRWQCARFDELTLRELYALLALRAQVFVVEQTCAYQDLDGHDPAANHLLGWGAADAEPAALLAYARLFAPGARYAEASVGRIVTAPAVRGRGLGRGLVARAIEECAARFGPAPIRISAQAHLQRFYEEQGFVREGAPYDEDGIPHVQMVRPAELERAR